MAYPDDIAKLYKVLSEDGYDNLGTEEEFRTRLQDPSSVDKLYASLVEDGYEDLGTRDEFAGRLTGGTPAGEPQGTVSGERPADESTGTVTNNGNLAGQPMGVVGGYVSPWAQATGGGQPGNNPQGEPAGAVNYGQGQPLRPQWQPESNPQAKPAGAVGGFGPQGQPAGAVGGGNGNLDAAVAAVTQEQPAQPVDWRDEEVAINTGTTGTSMKPTIKKKGELLDELYKKMTQAYNSINVQEGGQSAYAQMRDYAYGFGLDDDRVNNPEARKFIHAVHRQFATDRANELAQELLAKLPERTDDPQEALLSLYYDRNFQQKVNDTVARMGTDYNDFVNGILNPILRKAAGAKYPYQTNSYGVSGLYTNFGDIQDEVERREVANLLRERYAPDVTGSIEAAEARGRNAEAGIVQPSNDNSTGNMSGLMYAVMGAKRNNAEKDPVKILEDIKMNVGGAVTEMLQEPKLFEDIWQRAESKGMTAEDYIDKYVAPQIQGIIQQQLHDELVRRELPQGDIDYVLRGLTEDNILAMIINKQIRTAAQQDIVNEAQQLTDSGLNPYYNPGILAQGGRMATGMAADFWLWGGWGKVGEMVTTRMLGQRIAARAAAENVSIDVAKRMIEEEGKHYWKASVVENLLRRIPSSAITMGGAEATTAGVQGWRDRLGLGQIAENVVDQAIHGALVGSAFGATGAVAGTMTRNLKGWQRIAGSLGAFTTEAGTMYTTEELAKMANGEEGFTDPMKGLVEAGVKLGFIKMSANPMKPLMKLGEALAHPVKTAKAVPGKIRDYMAGDQTTFTEADVAKIRESAEGAELMDALVSMRPVNHKGESEGYITREQAEQLDQNYRQFMTDPEIPHELKQKMAQFLGGVAKPAGLEITAEVEPGTDGRYVLRTRDMDGQCIREISFDSEADAQKAMEEMSQDFSNNLTQSLTRKIDEQLVYDEYMENMDQLYEQTIEKMQRGEELTEYEKTALMAVDYDLMDVFGHAANGTDMTVEEQKLYHDFWEYYNKRINQREGSNAFMTQYERKNELKAGTVSKAIQGHSLEEATRLAAEENSHLLGEGEGSDVVSAGDGKWRTRQEQWLVEQYQREMEQYLLEREYASMTTGERVQKLLEQQQTEGGDTPPEERRDVMVEATQAEHDLGRYFSEGEIAEIEQAEDPAALMERMLETGNYSDEQLLAVLDYYQKRVQAFGVLDAVSNEIEQAVNALRDNILSNTHADQKHIIMATNDGQPCFVTAGRIAINEDGTVDRANSGDVVIVRDENTGEQYPVNPGRLVINGVIEDAERYLESETTALREQMETATDQQLLQGLEESITEELEPVGEHEGAVEGETPADESTGTVTNNGTLAGEPEGAVEEGMPAAETPAGEPEGTVIEPAGAVDLTRITDKDGVKHYEQGVDVETAIQDMTADGIDPVMMADAMIQEQTKALEAIAKKKNPTPADIVKAAKVKKEAQVVIDYWNNVKAAAVTPAGEPEGAVSGETPADESTGTVTNNGTLAGEPEGAVNKPQGAGAVKKPAGAVNKPQGAAPAPKKKAAGTDQAKVAFKRVKQSVGTTLEHLYEDGSRTTMTIERMDPNGKTTVTQQDYDFRGNPVGEPVRREYDTTKLGTGIIEKKLKPIQNNREKLTEAMKNQLGSNRVISTFTDDEVNALWKLYEEGDGETFIPLYNQIRQEHFEDIIMVIRGERQADADKLLTRGNREEVIKGLKKLYNGNDMAIYALDNLEPATLEEYVAEGIGKGSLAWETYKMGDHEVRGLQDELGKDKKRSNFGRGDTTAFNYFLAKNGEGKSVQKLAEDIHETLPEGMKDQWDDQEIRNTIIDLLQSAGKPSDVYNLVLRNRAYDAERYAQEEEDEMINHGFSFQKAPDDRLARMNAALDEVGDAITDAEAEEAHVTEVRNTIDDLQKKYNSAPIEYADLDVPDEELIEKAGIPGTEEMSDDERHEYVEAFRNEVLTKNIPSFYNRFAKKIVIFASLLPQNKSKRVFFHENVHAILDKWYGEGKKGIAERFWDAAPDKVGSVSKETIMRDYDEEEWKEEFFTHCLGKALEEADNNKNVSEYGEQESEGVSPVRTQARTDAAATGGHGERRATEGEGAVQDRVSGADQDESGLQHEGRGRLIDEITGLLSDPGDSQRLGNLLKGLEREVEEAPADESTGTVAKNEADNLKVSEGDVPPTERDRVTRDALIDFFTEAGLPVHADDWREGQQVIDDYNKRLDELTGGELSSEDFIHAQKVSDKKTLDELNNGPTVKRYRAMQLIDGKLYPPMSAKVDGQMREPTEIGVWEQSEERPDLVKNGKFVLNKGQKGQGSVPAAYNPYFHTSTSGLNDQFTSAYKRPELVVVEVEIPESELTSGYKAEGAKDAVGDTNWHSGPVNGQLPDDKKRTVTLSRYAKVNRIVPDSEVAEMIAEQLDGTGVEVPYNVVTPQLRKELEARGVKISATPSGNVTEDINGRPMMQKVEPGPVFISNAKRAVEGISQQKATPEQWLKMIEKAGGLKAGEDKWIGLSEWLKRQDAKSLTKDEVLNYIRENQIRVEDVNYSEFVDIDNNPQMQEFRREFSEALKKYENELEAAEDEITAFNQEMLDKYGEGWASDLAKLSKEDQKRNQDIDSRYSVLTDNDLEQLAFSDLVEKYGDDFGMAFEVNYGNNELQPQMDMYGDSMSDAAKHFLQLDEQPINPTRLSYTTEGLDNKREIALVVPTIEPYNESDEIHFGDAGGGRAVAWARFGDAYVDESGKFTKVDPEWDDFMNKMAEKYGKDRNDSVGMLSSMTDEEREAMNKLDKAVREKEKQGKKRVLVIDEIQSKRHQDAREKGYKDVDKYKELRNQQRSLIEEKKAVVKEILHRQGYAHPDDLNDSAIKSEGYEWEPDVFDKADRGILGKKEEMDKIKSINAELDNITDQLNEVRNGVPGAPFEKNWHELAMKRMLRYAAENGYDKVAWTTGTQQAERYDIGGVVQQIEAYPHSDPMTGETIKDQYDVFVKGTNGGYIHEPGLEGVLTREQIMQNFGKDLGKRIIDEADAHPDGTAVISGDGLRIGGEGMKGFYDQILPRFMDKYGKKWGVKTGELELPDIGQKMHAVDVTPEMRESVMQGQPMFFRTKDGRAYGFTKDGEMYIDKRIATSETPIHEYGHLWCQAVRKNYPEVWAGIKKVVMDDPLVKPIIDKVRDEYPELQAKGREDDFVEEVVTQFSGKDGAERLRKLADEVAKEKGGAFGKAEAVTAMQRLKAALSKFWHTVCDLLHVKFTSAEEVADRILADMLRGWKPSGEGKKPAGKPAGVEAEANDDLKQRQLEIVTRENPMKDDIHTGIRKLEDIKTYNEAIKDDPTEDNYAPDYTREMVDKAIETGKITVYSSYPIKDGVFVTPSRMEAQNYAGEGKVYSQEVSLNDVAWIDPMQGQYAKVPDAKMQKVNYDSEEEQARTQQIFDAAKKLFGTTNDIREAGYVLPDGTMPDFSGRHQMDPGSDTSFLRGRRSVDHREVGSLAYERDGNTRTGIETDMPDFIRRGAIRIDDNAGNINLATKPTSKQKEVLRRLIARNDGYVQVDFGDGWDSDHYVEYDEAKPAKVLADIDRYFDEGIKPQSDIMFQLVGKKGATNADKAEESTIRRDNLNLARELEKELGKDGIDRKDARAIKFATGWERGKDGQWRYEIPDADVDMYKWYKDALLDASRREKALYHEYKELLQNNLQDQAIKKKQEWENFANSNVTGLTATLEEIIGKDNELFKYYPQLRKMEVKFGGLMGAAGGYNTEEKNIKINPNEFNRFNEKSLNNENAYGTLIHEIQHAVQDIEGFSTGGNLESAVTPEGLKNITEKKAEQLNILKKEYDADKRILDSPEFAEYAQLAGLTPERYREQLLSKMDRLAYDIDKIDGQIKRIQKTGTVSRTDAMDYYRSISGEVEARNATRRMNYTDEERMTHTAEESEDIPRDKQVVVVDNGNSASIQAGTDSQGNPVDKDGRLIVEKVKSIDDIHDDDFTSPSRTVELPKIPENLDKALGAKGKPVIIKKNIFEKNLRAHKDLTPAKSREILTNALYNTKLYGQTQPKSRPNYWVAIKLADPNSVVVLEIANKKNNVEIVGWRYSGDTQLENLKKQAEREGGQLLILTSNNEAAAGLSTLPSGLSGDKGTNISGNNQENEQENANFRDGEAQIVPIGSKKKLTPKQQRERMAFAERQWRRAHNDAAETVKKLHLEDKVTIVDSTDELDGHESFSARKKRSKGWYDPDTNRIVVVIGNHRSPVDVVKTILHEGVVHYGLRELFGKNFDTFLDNVYESAHYSIKQDIDELKKKYDGDTRKATEEMMGKLAEDTDFEDAENKPWVNHWFNKIKEAFLKMLKKIGLPGFAKNNIDLTLDELRYILWRSYKNLTEPGRYRNVFKEEEGVAKEVKMPVKKKIEDEIPQIIKDYNDELYIRKKVSEMSLKEAQEAYKRIDDSMRDENGLDLDEQLESNKAAYREKYGLTGIGQFAARDFQRVLDKYGSAMVTLRWELQDRILDLGGSLASESDNELFRDPEDELTPEERQYWREWDKAMEKWKAKNGLPKDAEMLEKPTWTRGDDPVKYSKKLMAYTRDQALWKTAPKLEDYRQRRADKDAIDAARQDEAALPGSDWAKRKRIAAELTRLRHAMSRQKKYDRDTVKAVVDFAKDFMTQGYGDTMGRGDIQRLLSSVKNATGANSIKKYVDNIMDILINNQLRNLENRVQKLSSVRELKLTAQGVEAQGKLEMKGQAMIQAFRKARQERMTPDKIKERMDELTAYMNENPEGRDMWESEYEGLATALQYAESIDVSRQEWADLDKAYNDAIKNYQQSGRSYQDQQELLESIATAKQENLAERIGMYNDVINRLASNISESVEGARDFVRRERERQEYIYKLANADLKGRDAGTFRVNTPLSRLVNKNGVRFFLSPLATFEQILREFGRRNANGEGNLYNEFMRNWLEATNNEYIGMRDAKAILDKKAQELFGVKRWSDLYKIARQGETADITILDGGKEKTFKLTQGNMMYIYMVNKMNDGAMKLRYMGISDADVEKMKDKLDSRLVTLADWIQDEYLPQLRNKYNEVYQRMFGAPMATIDNYFPLKIHQDALYKEYDPSNPVDLDEALPSTVTGSVIKRTRNVLPLDILNADALSTVIEHVEDMEHWAAFAEWNKDVKTLLSFKPFENKVKSMSTIYGSGPQLWKTFFDTARMASGTYRPIVKPGSVDKTVSNIAKGVTAAKIAFRFYTAFKQTLSAPAFLHDVRLDDFVKYSANPYGSWKWAMENMPIFEKRWKSRQAGDTRLMDDPTDWKMWKDNILQLASRMGMSANALVDGITCAVGARAVYDGRLRRYKALGMTTKAAEKRALQDAMIAYNLTQQSSEGAFVSAIQKDRTVAANALSVFRNSPMAYQRQGVDAIRNLKHQLEKGYREDAIDFMTQQLLNDPDVDLTEEAARKAAETAYHKATWKNMGKMFNMLWVAPIVWGLGKYLPYLLFGDDSKEKQEMLTDVIVNELISGPVEGLTGGNIISDLVGRGTSEQTRQALKSDGWGAALDEAVKQTGDYEINPLPLMADIDRMLGKLKYDKLAALQDVTNIGVQSLLGVNPQTATDMWNAMVDYGMVNWLPGIDAENHNQDLLNMQELGLFLLRMANAPTSSWRGKYIDELGMTADEARDLSYEAMAERYANYKHWKEAPMMGWLRGEEGRQKKMETYMKQFDKAVAERLQRYDDQELLNAWENANGIEERKGIGSIMAKRLGVTDKEGNDASSKKAKEWQRSYQLRRTYSDAQADMELTKLMADTKARGDKETLKTLKHKVKLITGYKMNLEKDDDPDEQMRMIRKERTEAIKIALEAAANRFIDN